MERIGRHASGYAARLTLTGMSFNFEQILIFAVMKRLFLLDAYALIYRAYYALIRSPRVTSKGVNTSAVFGFCNTLDEILRKENPTHIAVCFDPKGPTFRHEAYAGYKAQRDKQPEDITLAVPYIKRILEAYRIPVVEVEGYEADDVIGTLSRMAEREGFETYMMTPDKDYGQLVTDRVKMYRPALRGEGFEIRGPREVCERYGVARPSQVIDLLALEGDVSDNIPGCPGVGEKTARKLIAEWGSVENLLDHASELKGALRGKIEDNAEQIRFSKYLVTIRTDVPLPPDVTPGNMERRAEDVEALIEVYRELEFKTFISRLKARAVVSGAPVKSEAPPAPADGMGSLFDLPAINTDEGKTIRPVECMADSYRIAATAEEAAEAIRRMASGSVVGVAVNAPGEEAMRATFEGVALCCAECNAVYLPFPEGHDARQRFAAMLQPLFDGHVTVVSHDVKRDMLLLRRIGVDFAGDNYFDTAVAHYLIDSESKHTLPVIMERYLALEPVNMADPKARNSAVSSTVAEAAARYCEEADVALRLYRPLMADVKAEGLTPLLRDIELPMVRVLAEMEWTGVRIAPAELREQSHRFTAQIAEMEEEAYRLAGVRFNVGSPGQVGEILFGRLQLDPKAKKTSTGAYATTEKILEKHRADHPLVDLILKIRKLRKLTATYLDALPALVNPETGKIHTTYNQTVAATGRLSSANPNLQNIPVRSDDGREIRRAFIADEGDLFMSADYSQIELRLIADLSADPDMTQAFIEGDDIHRATAAKIYHESLESVTDDQRRNAKTANFGIIYGISAFGLSERLGIPRSEAKMLIDGYFATYPHIREYLDKAVETARAKGYVETICGRKRRLPDINSRNAVVRGYAERNAVNAPLQGSAADIIKMAMVAIYSEIGRRNLRSRMIMQVHDELIFNVVPDELGEMQELVTRCMENAYSNRVPLKVSMGIGANWLEAH